jgi:hypothetical protein
MAESQKQYWPMLKLAPKFHFLRLCCSLLVVTWAFAHAPSMAETEKKKPQGKPTTEAAKPAKLPIAQPAVTEDATRIARSQLSLSAVLGTDTTLIPSGLVWRIYALEGDNRQPREVARSEQPAPIFDLPSGDYVVHAAYGFGSIARRVSLKTQSVDERLSLPVGGITVRGMLNDAVISSDDLTIAVYIPSEINSEEKLLTDKLKSGELLRLPQGRYHIVSTYGASNASVRADIEVKTGKAIDVMMRHRAARVTLKLVGKKGGEAIANTEWTILTPGGDVVREDLGAFPSFVLAEGNYTAIARHDGKTFVEEIKIVSGPDRDIELLNAAPQ